ncbi:hypothetical protein Cpir12675_003240 [Ceratocystis pirilliformis]|uniref:Uncharacterized protein n=1 Tax=Ceratocystis pirilliformis TaxID=259994 RepID=A0ABR3Z567_9PEZI
MEDNSQILSLPNSTATIEVPAQNGEPASQTDAVSTSAAATTTTTATTAPAVASPIATAATSSMHNLPSISALATSQVQQGSQSSQVRTTMPPSQPMFMGASPAATAGGAGNTL